MTHQTASMNTSSVETAIIALYHQLLNAWNMRNAREYADLFAEDGNLIGFDGSQINGRAEAEVHISRIFADHQTAPYIGKVREVRMLAPDVAMLRAVVGMVPPGQNDINPAVNAIQTLIAVRHDQAWRIALFQNTPAQFHGRPDLVQQLTDELRALLQHEQKRDVA
jgi:uncharacterized protein (TIGR02246 family)